MHALNKIGNIHGHLLDRGPVVLLNVHQRTRILLGNEVDGHTLATEPTSTTDTMDVVLPARRYTTSLILRVNTFRWFELYYVCTHYLAFF